MVWFGLWVGLVKVAVKNDWGNPPLTLLAGWVCVCVMLCVLFVFGLCLGFLVWAHGFRMIDGLVWLNLGCVCQCYWQHMVLLLPGCPFVQALVWQYIHIHVYTQHVCISMV